MIRNDVIKLYIDGVLNGCPKSENKLYEYIVKIVNDFILRKYTSNITTIEDDVSEITIKVFAKLSEYDESISSFKTWITRISNNYMVDKWRCSQMNGGFVRFDDYTYTLNGEVKTNGDLYQINNTIDNSVAFDSTMSINNSLSFIESNISSNDYAMLKMKYYYGYSYNEIGNEFNVTSSTVGSRINYVKSIIKDKYCYSDVI